MRNPRTLLFAVGIADLLVAVLTLQGQLSDLWLPMISLAVGSAALGIASQWGKP